MFPFKLVVVIVASAQDGKVVSRTRFTDRAINVSDAMLVAQQIVESSTLVFRGETVELAVESISITRDDSPYMHWTDKVRQDLHREAVRMQRS